MQRKKKPNRQQAQHLAAQYRADFFRKMKLIIDSVCGNHIYPLIPTDILVEAYLNRVSPFRYYADCNSNISATMLKDVKVLITSITKERKLLLPPNNLEITICDYFTVALTIQVFNTRLIEDSFDNGPIVKKALATFVNNNDCMMDAANKLFNAFDIFGLAESDLRSMVYWLDYTIGKSEIPSFLIENRVILYSVVPEVISVEVEGIVRPATRVGWALGHVGPEWLSLKPSLLGVKSPFAEIPLKVYIQTHALNRLSERIDCFMTGSVQFSMFLSLRCPKLAYDVNHNLLIEYEYLGIKAGYFRADIVNGIILIRTFLFITNNGTPEGQLLEKNTGLQKLDKKYLNIDKLSTFMNSDLDKNLEAQKIFKNSGCQCLIDLYNNKKHLLERKNKEINFDVMLSYLDSNRTSTSPDNVLNSKEVLSLQTC